MATAKLTVPIFLEWKDIEAYMAQHDIVKVVRCKDCIHCDCSIDGMGFFYCDFDEGRTVSPNGFCDVAERRKEAEDGT